MADRYWVGGTANWDGTAGSKWALTSGGAGGQAIPTAADDVYFDANSGTNTITVFGGTVNCNNLTVVAGFTGIVTHTSITGSIIRVSGTILSIASGMGSNWTFKGNITPLTTATLIITCNGTVLCSVLTIGVSSKTTQLGDDLYMSYATTSTTTMGLFVTSGTFDANNKNLFIPNFSSTGSTIRVVTMGSGTWNINNTGISSSSGWVFWVISGSNITLNSNTSTIKCICTNGSMNARFDGGGYVYYNLWWARGAATAGYVNYMLTGSNSFNELKDDGTTSHNLTFGGGVATTVTTFNVNGASNFARITLESNGSNNTLSKASGIVNCVYLNIQHSIATGGATWNATNSINNNNIPTAGSGWNIISPFAGFFAGA